MTDSVLRDLEKTITQELSRIGLLFRIFSRKKDELSIRQKIGRKNYPNSAKKMQDLFGLRITAYFTDDLDITILLLKNLFEFVDETIDEPDSDTFKPQRINLIFRLSKDYTAQVSELRSFVEIDNTFEIQLRTVLAEGWHEVEHDQRYKQKEDWQSHDDLSRTLNGISATLENCDWSMLQIFEQLAHRNYKLGNWNAMLRNKFRLRLSPEPLESNLSKILTENQDVAKKIFRVDRQNFLSQIASKRIDLPMTLNNLIYIANLLTIKNQNILNMTPQMIKLEIDNAV